MKMMLKCAGMSAIAASVAFALSASGSDGVPQASDAPSLLLVGPVEAVIPTEQAAIILGQKIVFKSLERLTVGETAAVFGKLAGNGAVIASDVRSQGIYVAGATSVVLTGIVQKNQASVGRMVVGGLAIDLTPTMSNGSVSPIVGSKVQVVGTQPAGGGVILANGISGSGLSLNGISGSGHAVTQGISGSGLSLNGISGSGHAVTQGISGSGLSLNGISGSGHAVTQGISGSGHAVTQGISGSGLSLNGISGSGYSMSQSNSQR